MTDYSFLDYAQGSDEWHAWRRSVRTASTAAVVMDCAPTYWSIRTPEQLRAFMAGAEQAEPDEFTQGLFDRGHRTEAEVRQEMNREFEIDLQPTCVQWGGYGASLDGLDEQNRCWLEVKAPKDKMSMTWVLATQGLDDPKGRIPPHYWWQLVHQAACLPFRIKWCYFVVQVWDDSITITIPHSRLMEDWEELRDAWARFDGLEVHRPNVVPDDRAMATEWLRASHDMSIAKDRLERAKTALLSGGEREIPGMVKIAAQSRKGNIDWKTAWEFKGHDLEEAEDFRKSPSSHFVITPVA